MLTKEQKKQKILLVEDDRVLGEYLKQKFEEKGYYVYYYDIGEKALEEIKSGLEYDALLISPFIKAAHIKRETSYKDIIIASKKRNPDVHAITLSCYDKPLLSDMHINKRLVRINELTGIVGAYLRDKL